jgi:hypothetical protein
MEAEAGEEASVHASRFHAQGHSAILSQQVLLES